LKVGPRNGGRPKIEKTRIRIGKKMTLNQGENLSPLINILQKKIIKKTRKKRKKLVEADKL